MKRILLALALVGLQWLVPIAQGQDTNTLELIRSLQERIERLEEKLKALESKPESPTAPAKEERIEALDQKVKVLERKRELEEEAAEAKAKEAPKLSIGEKGFAFTSGDGNFALQLRGLLQVDSHTFFHDSGIVANDGILLRRARPILQGTVYRDFDFLFVPEFGGSGSPQIFDAYVNYRFRPWLQFQAGKFKEPVGLEYLQSDTRTFFNERGLPTYFVPGRDVGFMVHGNILDGVVNYQLGIFNGVGDGRNSNNVDFDDDKAVAARLFLQPLKQSSLAALRGLGLGLGGSYEHVQGTNVAALPATTGGSLPGYTTVGLQQFFAYNPTNRGTFVAPNGEHWRLSPQAYYYYGPFGLLGEYVISEQNVKRFGGTSTPSARLANTAWQIAGGWVITGEDATFEGVIPRNQFNPGQGKWGAWQIVGRYGQADVDHDAFPIFSDPGSSARTAKEWSVGLNWYVNRNVRANVSYSQTRFDGGGTGGTAPGAVTRRSEEALFTRIQLAF